ncbi:LysR family transcriptional regulator [Brachybacterium hainanense]|uniref:LysR family transcriptional regulator n=1 Tax=Brachybacterium hainanense TaxID=1541174 RepID=A0ABV6RGJ3_9MICO
MTMMQLRAFDAVVAENGIGAAARALGVSQPTVSAQLSALERAHGVQLVDRRSGEPTPLGARLRRITGPMLDLERSATALLSAAAGTGTGALRIAADAPAHVMPLLAGLEPAHPGTMLELRTLNSARALAALRAGEVDLVVAAEVAPAPDLHRLPLQSQDLAAVVRTDHPLAGRRSLPCSHLAQQRLIGREEGSLTRAVLERTLAGMGLTAVPAMIADGREAMLAAVAAGLGIGVVAEHELLDDPRLVMLDLTAPTITITEHLVCAAHRREEPLIAAVLAAAQERTGRRGAGAAPAAGSPGTEPHAPGTEPDIRYRSGPSPL